MSPVESTFAAARPRLYAVALRVLGDAGDAEDVVQETWLRWERADRSDVVSPAAFLAVTATRLALNVASSARRRHETASLTARPEPPDPGIRPEAAAELRDSVDAVIRLMLERLTPAERAAYLLRRAFLYPYRRIAALLRLTEGHARQLVRRAQIAATGERRLPVEASAHRRLVRAFLAAARTGELGELEHLLTADLRRAGG